MLQWLKKIFGISPKAPPAHNDRRGFEKRHPHQKRHPEHHGKHPKHQKHPKFGDSKHQAPRAQAPAPKAPPEEPRVAFSSFELHEKIHEGIKDLRYETATPIQAKAIPLILQGRDLIACAQTGTGKTAAFLIPILSALAERHESGTKVLVLSPTRELAQQIEDIFTGLAYHTHLKSVTVLGGMDSVPQEYGLKAGVDVVIATPGRLLDHMRFGICDFTRVSHFVIDEADRMYDMGFLPDLTKIIEALPKQRQTLLFSATMPDAIQKLVVETLQNPEKISAGQVNRASKTVDQKVLCVDSQKKNDLLVKILRDPDVKSAIVFSNTKKGAEKTHSFIQRKGVTSEVIHGDREQGERTEALNAFRSGRVKVLVATDVAARGIDVTGVSHVINLEVPVSSDDYIHRIGRTGRAEFLGEALTLLSEDEFRNWDRMLGQLKSEIPAETTSFFSGTLPEFGKRTHEDHHHRSGGKHGGGGGRHGRSRHQRR